MEVELQDIFQANGIEILRSLGTGGESEVFLGRLKSKDPSDTSATDENSSTASSAAGLSAFKVKSKVGKNMTDTLSLQQECHIMRKLKHQHILRLHNVIETPNYLIMQTDYAKNGDLLNYINDNPRLPEAEGRRLFKQICEGLSYAHSQEIAHNDIKLDNIFLDENMNVLIGDWGHATFTYSQGKCNKGSFFYCSPEMLCRRRCSGKDSDTWALAVVLYAMVMKELPFDGCTNEDIRENVVAARFSFKKTLSRECEDLISGVFKPKQELRLSLNEVCSHSWTKGAGNIGNFAMTPTK